MGMGPGSGRLQPPSFHSSSQGWGLTSTCKWQSMRPRCNIISLATRRVNKHVIHEFANCPSFSSSAIFPRLSAWHPSSGQGLGGRPWLSLRRQLAWELDTPGPALLPCHRHLRLRAPLPQTTHKAGSPWHSIFYFLKLYTNVKYFNSESMGKLFGFKLLWNRT